MGFGSWTPEEAPSQRGWLLCRVGVRHGHNSSWSGVGAAVDKTMASPSSILALSFFFGVFTHLFFVK